MTKVYEVTRSYTTCEVHLVEANNEEEAKKKVVVLGQYTTQKSYDGDYDDLVTVSEVTDSFDTYEYCEECNCILRWNEAETLCKSCEERKEEG